MMNWIISSSVLILVVVLLRYLCRGKISLRLQYALWALVLVRLLVPLNFGSAAFSVMNTASRAPLVQDVASLQNVTSIEFTGGGTVEGYSRYELMPEAPTVIAENQSAADFTRMQTVLRLRDVLSPLWKIGMAVILLAFALSNAKFRSALKKARTRLEKPGYPLPVYVTDAVDTPCLFGLLRPTVYIPQAVQENPTALHHALEHELTHFRQGDHFWAFLRCACLALHWYNPLVWWAAILSRRDAELSCDEGTIRRLGESARIEYGRTLIDLTCAKHAPTALLCTATTMTGSQTGIRERITLIAAHPKTLLSAAATAALVVAVTVGCTFTGAKPAADSAPAEPAVSLTAEELAYFNDTYFNGEDFNLHNQFLTSLYDAPEDIDLFELFYCGTGQDEFLSEEERRAVGAFDENGEEICPTTRLPLSSMNAVLTENMGLTLEETHQIGLELFNYRPEYDAYYHTHGDTNYYFFATCTAGTRQGDLIRLLYDNGGKVVTLRETEDGGYHFVSNRYNGAPAVSAAVPPQEDAVLTVPLSELTPYAPEPVASEPFSRQDFGELLDMLSYQGAGPEPDRGILVGMWPDGGIYACYVVYDNTAGENVYRRFVRLFAAENAPYILEHPDLISVTPFTGIFGYDGFVLAADGLSRYYFFDADGSLNLLYSGSGSLKQLFTAGDGCVYAFDDAGGIPDPAMLVQKGGTLYRADLAELLTRLIPDLFEPWLGALSSDGVGTLCCYDASNEPLPVCTRRIACDGEALQLYYGDGKTYTGHLEDDIDVPADVLAAAQDRAQASYELIAENRGGSSDLDWMPDDWRITDLYLARTVEMHGLTIEVYTQSILVHAAAPEKVILAGGSYITEDGWVAQDGMSGEYFILPFAIQNGRRLLLTGELANDYGIDSDAFDCDLRNLLISNGLIAFTDLDGGALLEDFYLQYPRFLTRLGSLPEAERAALCQRMIDAASGDEALRFYWEDTLTTVSWVTGSLDEVQNSAYETLRSFADSSIA